MRILNEQRNELLDVINLEDWMDKFSTITRKYITSFVDHE